jgi:hypothetical protein
VYWVVGLDRSAFGLFDSATNTATDVVTYETQAPLFYVKGGDKASIWQSIIQGIPAESNQRFIDHLESYEFRRPQGDCHVVAQQLRMADPFDGQAMNIVLWLPVRTGRRAMVETPPGLTLRPPVIGFVDAA